MFSFIKKYAASINGIEVYPKVGLIIFGLVFIVMVWFAIRASKEYMDELAHLPIEEEQQ